MTRRRPPERHEVMEAREVELSERQQGAIVGLLGFFYFVMSVGMPILVLLLAGMYAEETGVPAWQVVVLTVVATVIGYGYLLVKRARQR